MYVVHICEEVANLGWDVRNVLSYTSDDIRRDHDQPGTVYTSALTRSSQGRRQDRDE